MVRFGKAVIFPDMYTRAIAILVACIIAIIAIAGINFFAPASIVYFVSIILLIFGAFVLVTCVLDIIASEFLPSL